MALFAQSLPLRDGLSLLVLAVSFRSDRCWDTVSCKVAPALLHGYVFPFRMTGVTLPQKVFLQEGLSPSWIFLVQGYLAHKKARTLLGRPSGPLVPHILIGGGAFY